MQRRGFTLVELMIVVALLGVLAAIAVPMYRGYLQDARTAEAKSNLETLRLLEEQYFADNRAYAAGSYTSAADTLTAVLPGFQPGNRANLFYDYDVVAGGGGTTFTATATPRAGKASGPPLWIKETNERSW